MKNFDNVRLKTRFQQKGNRISRLFSPVLYLRQLADYGGSFYNQKKDFRRDQRLAGPQAQRGGSERASAEEKCVKDACAARTRCTAAISGTFPTLAAVIVPGSIVVLHRPIKPFVPVKSDLLRSHRECLSYAVQSMWERL